MISLNFNMSLYSCIFSLVFGAVSAILYRVLKALAVFLKQKTRFIFRANNPQKDAGRGIGFLDFCFTLAIGFIYLIQQYFFTDGIFVIYSLFAFLVAHFLMRWFLTVGGERA